MRGRSRACSLQQQHASLRVTNTKTITSCQHDCAFVAISESSRVSSFFTECLFLNLWHSSALQSVEVTGMISSLPCPPCTRTTASSRRPSRPFRSRGLDTTAVLCRQNPQTNSRRILRKRMMYLQLLRAGLDAPCRPLNTQP